MNQNRIAREGDAAAGPAGPHGVRVPWPCRGPVLLEGWAGPCTTGLEAAQPSSGAAPPGVLGPSCPDWSWALHSPQRSSSVPGPRGSTRNRVGAPGQSWAGLGPALPVTALDAGTASRQNQTPVRTRSRQSQVTGRGPCAGMRQRQGLGWGEGTIFSQIQVIG